MSNTISVPVDSLRSSFDQLELSMASFAKTSKLVVGFSEALKGALNPGLKLNTALTNLAVTTSMTGNQLKEIEGYARQTAKIFGVTAVQGVESYQEILSKLSPEIGKVPQALSSMGMSIAKLGKIMGGDVPGATEMLISTMQQFKVASKDPIDASDMMARMMNTMAAAAQAGSAKLPEVKTALMQCGLSANAANISFEEVNAAIQLLDAVGKQGAEGGNALNDILTMLSQSKALPENIQTELSAAGVNMSKLTDISQSFAERLEALSPVANNASLITRLFGEENIIAAQTLLTNTEQMQGLTLAITETQVAEEQAAIIMLGKEEQMARINALMEDYKISLFNATGGLMPLIEMTTQILTPLTQMATLVTEVGTNLKVFGSTTIVGGIAEAVKAMGNFALSLLTTGTTSAEFESKASLAFNNFKSFAITTCKSIGTAIKSISVFGWRTIVVGALATAVSWAWDKFEGFRKTVMGVWEVIKGFGQTLKDVFIETLKSILNGFSSLGSAILKLLKLDFTGAATDAKKAATELFKASPIGIVANVAVKTISRVKSDYAKGETKGAESWSGSRKNENSPKETVIEPIVVPEFKIPELSTYSEEISKKIKITPVVAITGVEKIQAQIDSIRVKSIAINPIDVDAAAKVTAYTSAIKQMNSEITFAKNVNEAFCNSSNTVATEMSSMKKAVEQLINAGFSPSSEEIGNLVKDFNKLEKTTKKFSVNLSSNVTDIIVSIAENLGKALVSGDWAAAFVSIMSGVMDMLIQFGTALISFGVGVIAFEAATLNPVAAIIAGVSLVLLASVAKAAMETVSFADGGIVSGPTMALVGEYSGASNNPEVIAPLNKLKALIQPEGFRGTVEFEIRGRKLVGLLNKENNYFNRTR